MVVDRSGHRHVAGGEVRVGSGKARGITEGHRHRVGEGSHSLVGSQVQHRVACRSVGQACDVRKGQIGVGRGSDSLEVDPKPVAVGHPDVRRERTAEAHDHVAEGDTAVGKRSGGVVVDVGGDGEGVGALAAVGSGERGIITVDHLD